MLTNNLLYLINFFEFISAVLAIVFFYKYKNSTEKWFVYFLLINFLVDILGLFWGFFSDKSNYWIYNLYIFFFFIFYFYWFNLLLKREVFKKAVIIFGVVFIITGINNFLNQPWDGYHKITFITGAFFTVFSATFHFYELLNNDEIIDVKHKLSFWISAGLLLFNVGMIPFMIFSDTFDSYHNYRNIILIFLNLILYTCYSLGFIWVKEKNSS